MKIKIYTSKIWAQMAASLIDKEIRLACKKGYRAKVMLTGGGAAAKLYEAWSCQPSFKTLSGINFYLSDERFVPNYHVDSNSKMIKESLFANGLPNDCNFYEINCSQGADPIKSASDYEDLLPNIIDILILTLGDDGHIASLFPGDPVFFESKRRVVSIGRPSGQLSRISITPLVIKNSKFVFILAPGLAKRQMANKIIKSPNEVISMPATLALQGTWIFDNYD
jgi:6-phosphogluconolactonase